MSYAKKAFKGSLWMLLSTLFASVIFYIFRIILARALGAEEYGLFFAVFTLVAFFFVFRDLGLSSALTKFIPEYNIKRQKENLVKSAKMVILVQVFSTMIFGTAVFLTAGLLAKNYFKNDLAYSLLLLYIPYFLFSALTITGRNIVLGFHDTKSYAISMYIRNTALILATILLLYTGLGIWAPMFAYVLSWLVTIPHITWRSLSLLPKSLLLKTHFTWQLDKSIFKSFIHYGLSLTAASFGNRIISYFDTIMLTYFATLEDVGVYNVVLPTALILIRFLGAVRTPMIPIISELWAKKDKKKIQDGYSLLYKYFYVLLLPVVLAVAVFSRELLSIFFGSEYAKGYAALIILTIGAIIAVFAMLNNTGQAAMGFPEQVTKQFGYAALLNIAMNIVLIPTIGISGAALATSLSYALLFILSMHSINNLVRISFPLKHWALTTLTGILFLITAYLAKSWLSLAPAFEILIAIPVALAVYALMVILLKLVDYKEIMFYKNIIQRK